MRICRSLVALVAGAALLAQQPERWAPLAERVRGLAEQERHDKRLRGIAYAVLAGDRIVLSGGVGFAGGTRPIDGRTVARVGSVSKLFTDLAVLAFCDEGRLALDADVRQWLPDFAPGRDASPITLRELITHHAGLPREPRRGHYFDPEPPDLAETVESLNEQARVHAPGKQFKYSNAGITVLGRVLEVVAAAPFDQVIRDRICVPLGLRDCSFAPDDALRARLADGWMWTYDGREMPAPRFRLGIGPAGDLHATPEELVRFARAWFVAGEHPRIVPVARLREAMQLQGTHAGRGEGIGLGVFVDALDGALRVHHGGAVYGFATELAILPEEQLAAAVVVTHDFANAVAERIAEHALRLARAVQQQSTLPEPPPRAEPLGAGVARALAGTYAGGAERVTLLEQDGELLLEPREGTRRRIRLAGGKLVVDGRIAIGGELTLDRDRLRWGDRDLLRTADAAPAPAPDEWLRWIGEYGWDHDVLYVLERDDELAILIEWFGYYVLVPDGAEFRLTGGWYSDERVRFVEDAERRVLGVEIGGVFFPRRAVPPEPGQTFRIPARYDLRQLQALAAQARMPEQAARRAADLVDLREAEPGIRFDLRYGTTDNFLGIAVYEHPRARLQRPAAEAFARAHRALAPRGFGLLVHDAYRPWSVTQMFWDATPPELRTFVADPSRGSRHNRGCAADVTLFELATGRAVEMVSGYDEFTPRAYAEYPGGTTRQRWHRRVLRDALEAEGFRVLPEEWWHFDHRDWGEYAVLDEKM